MGFMQRSFACDKTGSGTETAINTVATLSKDILEEQHEDWPFPNHFSPIVMAIMSELVIITSRPISAEIAGPVSGGLRQYSPSFFQHNEFTGIGDLPTLTVPRQERFIDSRSVSIGSYLRGIPQVHDRDPYNWDSLALLGTATTNICATVYPCTVVLVAEPFILLDCPLLSRWPGYANWRRQILTRDETYSRNPITVGRFMKHVGASINNFINVSSRFFRCHCH